eukprot:Skav213140  [mRNA]  locus=scaffold107:466615:469372:+ [translate_table: standard]
MTWVLKTWQLEEGMTWLFDNCGGHGDTYGHYHYHAPPLCLLRSLGVPVPVNSSWWKNEGVKAWPSHGPELQIGWALDGAPIMGPFKGGIRTEKKVVAEQGVTAAARVAEQGVTAAGVEQALVAAGVEQALAAAGVEQALAAADVEQALAAADVEQALAAADVEQALAAAGAEQPLVAVAVEQAPVAAGVDTPTSVRDRCSAPRV